MWRVVNREGGQWEGGERGGGEWEGGDQEGGESGHTNNSKYQFLNDQVWL